MMQASGVKDYDQPIISCLNNGRGVVITSQSCTFSSEQTTISYQYKEEEHVRVSFVIQKNSSQRLVFVYVNGIASGVIRYATDDDFTQQIPQDITIGSSYATVDIYTIRMYNNDLRWNQIVQNWIADTANGELLVDRYRDNDVYDDNGEITINKLPSKLPYMILIAAELPQYKGDKKTVSVTYTNPLNMSKSFTAEGCQADVQGTSSQYYARKNYKLKFNQGFVLTSTSETVSKYQLRDTSIPEKTFCMKADVASSEGVNNVELVRYYNDNCPYKTPGQIENSSVRQGIDGFPIVIFWHDSVNNTTTFLGKYNFNNDKSTEDTFGFADDDESWEIKNNTSDLVRWKSDDYTQQSIDPDTGNPYPSWYDDFEARYPDIDPVYVDNTQLQAFSTWLVSTDPDQATGQILSSEKFFPKIGFCLC